MKKVLSFILKILSSLSTILLVVLLITTMYQRMNNEIPGFMGYHLMYVLTGSMEPEIMTNDAVVVKDFKGQDAKIDDVVCYIAEKGAIQGSTIIHKVIKEPYEENGQMYLVTKGIANATADDPIKVESVFGKVVMKVSILGKAVTFFKTVPGLIALVSPIIYCIIKEIIEIKKIVSEE